MKRTPRTMLTGTNACGAGCAYCFASMPEYSGQNAINAEKVSMRGMSGLIYPICDSEIAYNLPLLERIVEDCRESSMPQFISISSKLLLSDTVISQLSEANRRLSLRGGFLKLAASFSVAGAQLRNEYETGSSSLEKRLSNLRRARSLGVPVSVTIKPLLPWIDIAEYEEIISASISTTNLFTIGGLYLSETTPFGRKVLDQYKHLAVDRVVDWLPKRPFWKYVEDPSQIESVKLRISSHGGRSFDSDSSLIQQIELERSQKQLSKTHG